ncbi:uncharacterized protein N7483_000461 [Penicillium malachiteum]|uniref:uncharacterized protein n=1 Tax=Penicillium malachiteum TaxID=1324776 RepID=UPI002546AF53|nr:uncharacterized protein N7483_000461 [Penicillium malachiteum]KAJ5735336.1 hypothetical protein N7483_000461 [Penicillium malachiteum]
MKHISLSPMNNVMPRFYAPLIFAFRCPADQDDLRVRDLLERGLHHTSTDIPSIAGKLCPTVHAHDLRDKLDYDELVEDGLPQDLLDPNRLLPTTEWPDPNKGVPVFLAQANFVMGGVLLAVGMYHSTIDGTSCEWLMKKWAEHTRQLQKLSDGRPLLQILPRSADPGILEELWHAQGYTSLTAEELQTNARGSDDPSLWRLLGLDSVHKTPSPPFMAELEGPESRSMQAIIRARFPDDYDEESSTNTDDAVLDTTYDGRLGFSPDLPFTYMASLIFIRTTRILRSQLMSPTTSLRSIAHEIRQAADKIDSSQMHAAFTLAASLPQYSKSTFPFATFAGAEVCITSWIRLEPF